jgi:hypothetical protein
MSDNLAILIPVDPYLVPDHDHIEDARARLEEFFTDA